MKPDEWSLFMGVYHGHHRDPKMRLMPMDVARLMGIPPKRANYLYLKWARKGLFEYGVSARTGWLTAAGIEHARAIQGSNPHFRNDPDYV